MGQQEARDIRQAVHSATLTVDFSELTASAGTQTFPFSVGLPSTAVLLAVGLDVTAGFTDGSGGVFTADLGDGTTVDSMLDGADLASVAAVAIPLGAVPVGLVGAITPELTILANVDVDTVTAGSVTAVIKYAV